MTDERNSANSSGENSNNSQSGKKSLSEKVKTTPGIVLATALGMVMIVAVILFLLPGLNSLKIELFQASVEIDNEDDAFEVLEGIQNDPESRKLLDLWLDDQGYISLKSQPGEGDDPVDLARKQAGKFAELVPDSKIEMRAGPDKVNEALNEFSARTAPDTLAGQLRLLAEKRDPPFNIPGVSAQASKPGYLPHRPSKNTIFIRSDAAFAKYFVSGQTAEIVNPASLSAKPLIVRVEKRNISSETDMHLNNSQWCNLDLKSFADSASGTAQVILIPKEFSGTGDQQSPGMVGRDFLNADSLPGC